MPETTGALPPDAPANGRQRLQSALLRPSRAQAVVALLLALLAFATITQVRANRVDDSFAGYREQDLIDVLNGLAGTTQRAESEIARLEKARDRLRSDTTQHQAALAQAQKETDTLNILAGLVPVTGPGIRLTITEQDLGVTVGVFLNTIEELRAAGAEAIQINGKVRVVAQTSFTDALGGLLVDGQILSSPYVIDAIGAPDTLSGALTYPSGPIDQLLEDHAVVDPVQKLDSIDINSVRESPQSGG